MLLFSLLCFACLWDGCFGRTDLFLFSFANSDHWSDLRTFVMQYELPALPGMPGKVE